MNLERFSRTSGQFLRFALVGVGNTAVDFAVTNLLVLVLQPQGGVVLLGISLAACSLATLNSYFWNRWWTFRSSSSMQRAREMSKFFAVALISMGINSSVFLFLARTLPSRFPISPLLSINLAKLAGVAAAFAVSFLGYRYGVFQTEAIRSFRASFRFEEKGAPFLRQAVGVLLVGIGARVVYLSLTTAVFGDAVSYGWVADSISRGEFVRVDTCWSNLFSYWEALFRGLGLGLVPSAIASSLVPGIALAVPVAWIARMLFGSRTAWLAGILTAVHPRLVEYSCNGYPETFYLFFLTLGIGFSIRAVRRPSRWAAAAWGTAFGICFAVRDEAILAFVLSLAAVAMMPLLSRRRGIRDHRRGISSEGVGALVLVGVLTFMILGAAYAGLSMATLGTPGLDRQADRLWKQLSDPQDYRDAAMEIYGAHGDLYGVSAGSLEADSLQVKASLARRLPRNLMYSLERLPGVLLSPLPLFALLLPLFAHLRKNDAGGRLSLLVLLVFPLGFYPLIQVEPRLFLPILIPVNVFGAAGVEAFCAYVVRDSQRSRLFEVVAGGMLLLSLGLTVWRAVDVEAAYRHHREVGKWLESHSRIDEVIIGCGYGNASTSGFLAGRRTIPRIWTADPNDLAAFAAQKGGDLLLIYESFLDHVNPELKIVLDSGIPGFVKVFETSDRHGKRVQVFRVVGKSNSVSR